MNKRQQNIMNMHKAVIAFFDESSAVWKTNTPVAQAFSQFSNRTLTGKITDNSA